MGMSISGDAREVASGGGIKHIVVQVLPDGRLRSDDAAIYLGVGKQTMAQWRSNGTGPAWCRVANRIFYFRAALDEFIAESRNRSKRAG
jgi:Helix-turn-helix domain